MTRGCSSEAGGVGQTLWLTGGVVQISRCPGGGRRVSDAGHGSQLQLQFQQNTHPNGVSTSMKKKQQTAFKQNRRANADAGGACGAWSCPVEVEGRYNTRRARPSLEVSPSFRPWLGASLVGGRCVLCDHTPLPGIPFRSTRAEHKSDTNKAARIQLQY